MDSLARTWQSYDALQANLQPLHLSLKHYHGTVILFHFHVLPVDD